MADPIVVEDGKAAGAAPGTARKFVPLGVLCLALYLAAGVMFSLNVQLIGVSKHTWNKPYLESYMYHSVWVLIFPLAYVAWRLETCWKRTALPPVPWRTLAVWGLLGGPLIVLDSWLYYMSLARLSLSVNSVLANCGFLLIFGVSAVVLKEKVTLWKVLGCALACGGLVMVVFGSSPISDDNPSTGMGYLVLALSIVGNAAYVVLYVWLLRDAQQQFGVSSVLGLLSLAVVGIGAACIMWVGVVIAHFTGLEPFAMPTGRALTEMLISMAMDFVLNLFYVLGMLFTSAPFMSVGALLNIASNAVVQRLFLGTSTLLALGIGGVVLIVLGSLCFELSDVADAVVLRCRRRLEPTAAAAEEEQRALVVNEAT